MNTATRSLSINAAFLQEIKEDNRELRELLDSARCAVDDASRLGSAASHGIQRDVVQLLDRLRDQLAMHFALEEAYGYFHDAIDVAPRLSEEADKLRNEHQSLFTMICKLADETELHWRQGKLADRLVNLKVEYVTFAESLQDHETRENDLILEAFDHDIGVGD